MVWPHGKGRPIVQLPQGYTIRTYQPGDEPRFYLVMALAGWPGWDEERLRPWRPRILPEGWFMAVHTATSEIVATAMALSDMREFGSEGGELGWLAGDPAHAGKGLGMAVSAAATRRMLERGYHDVHLYTEDYRLAALKLYLKLGYVPYLYLPDMAERWKTACEAIHWPYTPDQWMA